MMHKYILTLLAAVAPLVSMADNYTVVVNTVAEYPDSAVVALTNPATGAGIAEAMVKDHRAVISGQCDAPFLATVNLGRDRMRIVVEDGTVTIPMDKMRRLFNGTATGTPSNDRIRDFYTTVMEPTNQVVMRNGMRLRNGEITQEDAQAAYDSVRTVQSAALRQLCLENATNMVGRWALDEYVDTYNGGSAELQQLADALPSEVSADLKLQNKLAYLRIVEATAPGQMYADFEATQPDGSVKRLSDFVGHGDVVVLDFWASWCMPCRREMPNIKNIYETYRDKGLKVISVAVFDEQPNTLKALEQLDMPWEQIINGGKTPAIRYGVTAIPHVIIFDGEGRILSRGLHGDELRAKVDEIMKKEL